MKLAPPPVLLSSTIWNSMYKFHMINQLIPLLIGMNTTSADHYAVSTQTWESGTKIQTRNQESSFKTKVAGENKNSQLLGFLSLSVILSLLTCESTKGYRILKGKALKKRTLSGEFKIDFKHRFERQEAKRQLYRTLWLLLPQERRMAENSKSIWDCTPQNYLESTYVPQTIVTTENDNVDLHFSPEDRSISNFKRLLYIISGFCLSSETVGSFPVNKMFLC